MSKVHVVGAGPAGSIAAMSALRSGHDVVVSEEHSVSGIPENCSGLISIDGLRSLRGYVDYEKFVMNHFYGANIHFLDEKLTVRRGEPVGVLCNRSGMDQALAERAESEGARINYGERIKDRFHAENIIGADGPISSVADHFSFQRTGRYAATLRAIVDFRCEDPNIVEVFLSNTLFPGFFGWVIPHDECTAEIGVGVELPNMVGNAWRRLLRLKGLGNAPRPKGALIPLETRPRAGMHIGGCNVLLVGDAAGHVKSTTGGGVVFGGNCAALAGRHATSPQRYELEWRLRHGLDLALHKAVHDYLVSKHDSGISALGRRLKKLGCDVYLSHHGHMDRPTNMIHPQMVLHILKNISGVA
jgi:digeranylgeranylglycerophospholipid reductase